MKLEDVPLNTKVKFDDLELTLIKFDCTCGVLKDAEGKRAYIRRWTEVEIVEVQK